MNDQKILLEIVQRWSIKEKPEYRGFRCANCQEYFFGGAWHHLLKNDRFLNPVHFCDGCEKLLKQQVLSFTRPLTTIDQAAFGENYQYSPEAKAQFKKIVEQLPLEYNVVRKKPFTCDLCHYNLAENKEGQQEGWHVWWNNDGTLVELHFCNRCKESLKII